MKKGNIINVVLVIAVFVLLGICALSVRIRPTADTVALLRTTSVTCDGCGARIEKVLQSNKGVASVEVNVPEGTVTVGYDSKEAKPEALASMVTEAGYRSRVERLLSVEQFRVLTGRMPGGGKAKTAICCGGGQ